MEELLSSPRPPPRPWTYYLRPIWYGTGIGALLALAVVAITWATGAEYQEVHGTFRLDGLQGTGFGSGGNTVLLPALFIVFGFFLGMMVAMYRKGRGL